MQLYLPALVIFVFGLGLLITSASSDPELSVLGFPLGATVVRREAVTP
jgi:hypothetical protein